MTGERFNDNEHGHVEELALKLTPEEQTKARYELGPDVLRCAYWYVVEVFGDAAHVYVRGRRGLIGILEVNNFNEGDL